MSKHSRYFILFHCKRIERTSNIPRKSFHFVVFRNDPGEIDFRDLFRQSPITDTMTFMKHLLLDFYERSSIDDLEIRRLWASNIFTRNGLVELGKINEYLGKEVESLGSLFENKSTLEMPLSLMEPPLLSNNLVVVLYFRLIILQCELDGQVVENRDIMCLREYSSAVCSGKLCRGLFEHLDKYLLKYISLEVIAILENVFI